MDNGAAQIGCSCGVVAAVAVNEMRRAAGDWFDVPPSKIADSTSKITLQRVAKMAPQWAAAGSYPENGSRLTSGNELQKLSRLLAPTELRTRARVEANKRMGEVGIMPLDIFLLRVARDVLAATSLVRMSIVNTSMCDQLGAHWIGVVYSVEAGCRPVEVIDLTDTEVAPRVYESWCEYMT